MTARTTHDLRCICSRHTKLAEYGVTLDGEPYLHLKIHKQGRVFGEVVATSGIVEVCCRECLRWTRVDIAPTLKVARQDAPPRVLTRV